ncbi:hypothetical protein GCM10010431_05890 [Streptomyces kunmingensis]
MCLAPPRFAQGGLDEPHAARNSQDASSQRSGSEAWIGDEEGSKEVRSAHKACRRRWTVENNEGVKKPALDISGPSGYTVPLRCLLAAPCPSPGACPRLSTVD